MDASVLSQSFRGQLLVSLEMLNGEIFEETRDFPSDTELFIYLGAAVLSRINADSGLRQMSKNVPLLWEIVEFSAENRLLRAKQITGELLEDEDDDEGVLTPIWFDTAIVGQLFDDYLRQGGVTQLEIPYEDDGQLFILFEGETLICPPGTTKEELMATLRQVFSDILKETGRYETIGETLDVDGKFVFTLVTLN